MAKPKRIEMDKAGKVADVKHELRALSEKLVEKNVITVKEKDDLKKTAEAKPK